MPVEGEQPGAMAGQHPRHGVLEPGEAGNRCGLIQISSARSPAQPLLPRGNDIGIVRVRATVQGMAVRERNSLNRWQPQAIALAIRQGETMPSQPAKKAANLRAIEQ